jgi:two-component system OmpR family response regulator
MENRIKVYLVDDDALFLKTLQIQFEQQTNFEIITYATGELCMENIQGNPDMIILDFHLDGIDLTAMNGIETLDKIKAFNSDIPVVMLSSQDKIDIAVSCMHHKAFDYVIKSETAFMRIQQNINAYFQYKKIKTELEWYMERMS